MAFMIRAGKIVPVLLGACLVLSLGGCAGQKTYSSSADAAPTYELGPAHRESGSTRQDSTQPVGAQRTCQDENLPESLVLDAKHVITSPSRWERQQWSRAALVAAAVGGAMLLDEEIRDAVQDNRGNTTDEIANWAEPFGSEASIAIVLGSYAGGWLFDLPRLEKFGRLSLEATVISAGMTAGLKSLFGRARPPEGDGAYSFIGPTLDGDHMSLPSGHATQAFAVASVAGEVYRENRFIRVGAYALACAVAWSRLNDDRHWASDVILGGAVGTAVGRAIVSRRERCKPKSTVLLPIFGPRETGIYLGIYF